MCTSLSHTPNICVSTNKSTTTKSNSTVNSSNSISIDSRKHLANNNNVKRSETKEMWKRLLTKLTSSKLWLTAWACFLITFIVMSGLTEFFGIALALCSVPLSYFAVNEIQKYLQNK